ncbi:MAG: Fic family protein [Cyclobacteriaceae bacterium]
MKPPYDITPTILKLIATISEKIGHVNANFLDKPSPQLRKQNNIKTIHSSLSIEGNTLTTDQITALLENKRVIGPQKDITEVINAISIYEQLNQFDPFSIESFLKAHKMLMKGLSESAGKLRTTGVGIVKGEHVQHIAPPHSRVAYLMNSLFDYLKDPDELCIIKSCVFHYEMEFIHPFADGNGRMGRLWQTLILMSEYRLFEFLPFETLIHETQDEYYKTLALCDKTGKSTPFIEYMLQLISKSLDSLSSVNSKTMTDLGRIEYFLSLDIQEFNRKNYLDVFKNISPATASRDLKKGVDLGFLVKTGDKNNTTYSKKS